MKKVSIFLFSLFICSYLVFSADLFSFCKKFGKQSVSWNASDTAEEENSENEKEEEAEKNKEELNAKEFFTTALRFPQSNFTIANTKSTIQFNNRILNGFENIFLPPPKLS